MEKISVKLLVLAAAMIAPNMVRSDNKTVEAKHVDQINTEELRVVAKAEQYCVYSTADSEQNS
jgi:hypothetical protein